jgi:LuxR family transcriptional regulator, maltose regulon positive regulatory protein
MRAVLARGTGDVVAAEQARDDAERHLARVRAADARPDLSALLLSRLGSVQLWVGRLEDAERTLREGLAVARQPGCEYPRLNMLGRLAGVEFRHGHLKRAAELGQR